MRRTSRQACRVSSRPWCASWRRSEESATTAVRMARSAAPRILAPRIRLRIAPVPAGRAWMPRRNSTSCSWVTSRTDREADVAAGGLATEAERGDPLRLVHLRILDVEPVGTERVVAHRLACVEEVVGEERVLGAAQLLVACREARVVEAHPLERPHALRLGADHHVVRADAVEEHLHRLEEAERDDRQEGLPLAVRGQD